MAPVLLLCGVGAADDEVAGVALALVDEGDALAVAEAPLMDDVPIGFTLVTFPLTTNMPFP